jgi:hypothetical protein
MIVNVADFCRFDPHRIHGPDINSDLDLITGLQTRIQN